MQTPPSPVLTSTLPMSGLIAGALACGNAVVVALLVELPQHSRHAEAETILVALVLAMFFAPGFLLFSAFLSCASWIWHGSADSVRPVWVDALVGIIGGGALGASYLVQDVMGIRPEQLSDLLGRNVSVVVLTTVVLGGGMGFASGGFTRWMLARIRQSDRTTSRLTELINLMFVSTITVPGVAMVFTFAHFTGRTSGWEVLAAPFVFMIALATIGGLGIVHLVAVLAFVVAHRTLLDGKGTVILEAVVSMGGSVLAIVAGVSILQDGMDNFRDGLSFGVAVVATLASAALIAVVLGLGWRQAPSPPS